MRAAEASHGIDAPDIATVFAAGRDDYPSIRIPSVATTAAGTVLALAEGRQKFADHAQNDIILKRSTDGGESWETLEVVASEGGDSLNDPSVVVDRRSGRIILHYARFAEGFHSDSAPPGYEDPRSSRNYVVYSDDDGRTWSEPCEITRAVKRPNVPAAVVTCGVGIQLRRKPYANRLVHAAYDCPQADSYVCYSDDGGATWTMGGVGLFSGDDLTEEPQVVELADGVVMMNARTKTKCRRVGLSRDGGATFGEMRPVRTLIDPGCQGGILRYSDPLDGGRSRILFSNPASETERMNGTVRLSYDEGQSWPVAKTIYEQDFAYSCLTVLPDKTIGCLFEKDDYNQIALARFSLGWLTDGEDEGQTGWTAGPGHRH